MFRFLARLTFPSTAVIHDENTHKASPNKALLVIDTSQSRAQLNSTHTARACSHRHRPTNQTLARGPQGLLDDREEGGQGRRCNLLCRPHHLLGAWAGSATPAEGHQGPRERENKLLGDLQETWAWHGRAAQSPLSHCL
jgi:hypothetical protein